jgi:hypothetical protein
MKGVPVWLVTERGFYSVVDKGDREGFLCVRARVRQDLHNLFELDSMNAYRDEVIETENSDYRFRVYVSREDWTAATADLAGQIDYPNFKNEVAAMQGRERERIYMGVWSALANLQRG